MIKNAILAVAFLLLQLISSNLFAQPEFKYGFGGGVNFSNIIEVNSYPLFEDITGEEYSNSYSLLLSNIGNQFFFHGEFVFDKLIIALKPGTYTYKFNKTDEIIFNSVSVKQTNAYLLRYIQIPLELKYRIAIGKLKPFLGGSFSYGHLLSQTNNGTHSFIRPKLSAGGIIGTYYSLNNIDLVLTAGYNLGLHNITQKSDRYNTTSTSPYSQSDITLNNLHLSLSVLFALNNEAPKGALACPSIQKTTHKKPKRK
jgi:hypothetical protein